MKKITVAVVGCGRIANGAHLPALNEMEDVRLKYVCDIVKEKAEKALKDFPKAENAINDYKIALSDEEVDAVMVLTPNFAHYTVTVDALNAGKHVFCEKPITVDYAKSKEMAEIADKKGKILNIGLCNRYDSRVELLARYVAEGKLGNIYHVACSFRNFRSIPGLGGPFTTKAQSGGGALIDWGVHFIDLILYVLGGAKALSASCCAYNGTAKDMKAYKYKNMWAEDTSDVENGTCDVEDFISGLIRTDKAGITFTGAWAQNVDKDEMWVDFLGDKGGIRLTYAGNFTFTDSATLESVTPECQQNKRYLEEDKAFIQSIRDMKKNKGNVIYALETAKIMEALYASAASGKEIQL